MPRNGSGVYSPPAADYPAVSNTLIESAKYNDLISDIATALSASIAKDGQTPVTADLPMSSHKLTGLGAGSAAGHSVRYEQLAENFPYGCMELRLSFTSGVPVTTADVTAQTTLYLTPYKGKRIALYDGVSAWVVRTTAEVSISLAGVISSTVPCDIFAYDSAGTVTLQITGWATATARSTGITYQDGILVANGSPTRRYIGTLIGTTGSLSEDSEAKRFLWNYYNRVRKSLKPALETTDSWNYTTGTIRQANANTINQLNFVIGVSEDVVTARIHASCLNSTGGVGVSVGVGLDDTTTFDAHGIYYGGYALVGYITLTAFWTGYPGIGKHFLSWNEWSAATGTTTWLGDAGAPTVCQSGIQGDIWC